MRNSKKVKKADNRLRNRLNSNIRGARRRYFKAARLKSVPRAFFGR